MCKMLVVILFGFMTVHNVMSCSPISFPTELADPFLQFSHALGLDPIIQSSTFQKLFASPIHAVESKDVLNSQQENKEFLKRMSDQLPSTTRCHEQRKDLVIAISTAPFSDNTVAQNLQVQRSSLRRLEAFTGKRVDNFGPYSEESMNVDGHYAYKISFQNSANCNEANEFTNKAVSYSRHIERAVVHCNCENFAVSKVRKNS